MYEKIVANRSFLSASTVIRTAQFSLADMLTHIQLEKTPVEIEKEVFKLWSYKKYDSDHWMMPTFAHLFSNSYAAGYYAYQYAEVLAADAFAAVSEAQTKEEKRKILNQYKKYILQTGGYQNMADKFKDFRGRDPEIHYFLKSYEILDEEKESNVLLKKAKFINS